MAPPQLLAGRRDHGSIRLRPCPAAATAARKMVREICSGCGLPAGLVEDAALVTGVLVTCSARQAHTAIQLRVEVSAGAVLVRVEDQGNVLPPPSGDDPASDGYSLDMVPRLAQRSGFVRTPTGRQGWALLAEQPGRDQPGIRCA